MFNAMALMAPLRYLDDHTSGPIVSGLDVTGVFVKSPRECCEILGAVSVFWLSHPRPPQPEQTQGVSWVSCRDPLV